MVGIELHLFMCEGEGILRIAFFMYLFMKLLILIEGFGLWAGVGWPNDVQPLIWAFKLVFKGPIFRLV